MDLSKINLPRLEYRTPMQHCLNLIKEADDMLFQIQRPIKQKLKEKERNKITPEFLRAVKSLSTRFKSYNKIEYTSTRPVQTVVEKLGPGCYNIERSFTPIAAPLNFLLEKPSVKNSPSINSPNFVEKNKSLQKNEYFVKNHNTRVMNVLDSRIIEQKKVKKRNRIKFIEKIGSLTNYKIIKKYKKICMLALIAFVNLTVCAHMNRMITSKKNLRIRSRRLLTWLVSVLRIVGKMQKKLRKIRRRVAYKNIKGVVDPVVRFIKKQRLKTINTLFKIVKGIQYMNLLFLLYSKWKNYIELIQRQFRKFLRIKKARVECLILFYDKYANGNKMWIGFRYPQKKEFVEKFLKIVLRNYSKVMCKFYNDSKPIMKNFSRNMFFLEGNASSELNGRKINFGQQKTPVFKLLTNKNQILDYINSYEKVLKKRIEFKYQKTFRNSKTIPRRT